MTTDPYPALTTQAVREAVRSKNDEIGGTPFTERSRDGLIVFNYAYAHPGLFTGPHATVLRECRGLIFDETEPNAPLSRPYQKFFNLGEVPEEEPHFRDKPHVILEKLDGSMIRPLLRDNRIIFGTKAGPTDVSQQVDAWAASRPDLIEWARFWVDSGYTPIFEWCSRKMRIVIDYPIDRLVLTGIRNTRTGAYVPYREMREAALGGGVDVVQVFDFDTGDRAAFEKYVRGLQDTEGFVVRFHDGYMLKIKADAYLKVHKTLDLLRSNRTMIRLIVGGELDDAKSRLRPIDVQSVNDFETAFWAGVAESARAAHRIAQEALTDGMTLPVFAQTVATKHPLQAFLFKAYKGGLGLKDLETEIRSHLVRLVVQQNRNDIEALAHCWNHVSWETYRSKAGLAANPDA